MKILTLLTILIFGVLCSQGSKTVYTQVTYMYDIKRGDMSSPYKRSYKFYLSYFDQMLTTDSNLIIFGNKQLQEYVWQRRKQHNTVFVRKELQSYRNMWYFQLIQKIREKDNNDPSFQYKIHPQYALQYYNPIMMAKLYLMTQALKYDKFNTDVLVWTDGGYMHIFPRNLVYPENVIKKFYQLIQPQWILFTYFQKMNIFKGYQKGEYRYIDRRIKFHEPALAGHMGGYIQILRDIKCAFENLLRITLENGDMNSDQSIVTLMPIRFPFLIPNTVNIYLDNFVNKFHIYQDIKRIEVHPRLFQGVFNTDGHLEINITKIVNMQAIHPNGGESIKNESLTIISLQQMENLQIMNKRQAHELVKLQRFLSKKLSSEKRMTFKKIAFLAVFIVIYFIIFVKNRKICKSIYQKLATSEQLSE